MIENFYRLEIHTSYEEENWRGIGNEFGYLMVKHGLKAPPWNEIEYNKYKYRFYFTERGFEEIGKTLYEIIKEHPSYKIRITQMAFPTPSPKIAYRDFNQVAFIIGEV